MVKAELERINSRSRGYGWQISEQAYHQVENALGLADFHIVSTDDDYTNDEATEMAVVGAWDKNETCDQALKFLQQNAPEAYVRAIYLTHQTPLPHAEEG